MSSSCQNTISNFSLANCFHFRAKEKEKLKQKKIEAREKNESLGPTRRMLKQSTMASSNSKLRVALDFSFDDLMSEKVPTVNNVFMVININI